MKGSILAVGCRCIQAFLAFGLGAGTSSAAETSPELEALKKGYKEELSRTVLPLREGFRKALQGLESQLAAKGDYAAARQVQQERIGLERLMERSPAPSAMAGAPGKYAGLIQLGALAESSAGLRWEGGSWTGWAEGSSLRWPLPAGLRAGGYAVELAYAATAGGSLPLGLKEDFHTLTREIKVSPTPSLTSPEGVVKLGTLRLRGGASTLELKLTGVLKVTDFRIFELRLIREESP